MVKKSGRSSSINLRNSGMPLLVMDCWEENLAPSQINDYKQKLLECQKAQEKVWGHCVKSSQQQKGQGSLR